mmetsp:Transcript_17154/g.37032  ORF Transcript_17154/g.37032 Transcript_17154/m.37032 type:complete len:808 (+) Transcript_17154:150-2573(+)
MAAGDAATVHCNTIYMTNPVSLEARSGATVDVTAELKIDGQLILKTLAKLAQSSGSKVLIGKSLYLAATYEIAETSRLSIGLNLYAPSNARLTIRGDSTSIEAGVNNPGLLSELHGYTEYVFGPAGTGIFDVGGALKIGSTAKLVVDATSYAGGKASIPLVKYKSREGAFDPEYVKIMGLAPRTSKEIVYGEDGVYLDIDGGSAPTPTTSNPTSKPITANPTTANPTPSPATSNPTLKPTTAIPTTANPTSKPSTSNPTLKPTTSNPTLKPTTSKPTPAPTDAPTPKVTPGPTSSPVKTAPPPTNAPHPSTETRITLTETGVVPITSMGVCPPPETTGVVIDGKDYAAGPGTISLYECSIINPAYDLINIRLVNFPEGLWFELSFKADSVDLVIKSLANYKEYWVHVRTSYKEGEYAEQVHTDHFPDFDWDTVPTWTRFRKNAHTPANPKPWNFNAGPYTDEEIESIANNHFLSWYGLNTPDHVIETWKRIKDASRAAGRDHKTMYYWNAESFWGTEGIGLKNEYLRSGAVGTNGRKLYDHSNPEMRDWWVAHGLEMSQDESSDGVFTDNTISRECDNRACDLEATDKSIMVKKLATMVPDNVLDIGNYLRQMIDDGNRFRMSYADGSYFEGTHFSPGNQNDLEGILVSMQLAREASWKKKVVMWTGSRRNCGCGFNNPATPYCKPGETVGCIPQFCRGFVQVQDEPIALIRRDLEIAMAEFLMIVEKWSYGNFSMSPDASCEGWRWDWTHVDLLSKPLGKPLGPPLKSGHTFSRHFEHLSVKISLKKESHNDSAHGVGGDVTYIWR